MSTGDINYDRINDYGAVRISLASPHDIRSWSFGEVKKPETINYRTYRPEKDGLFCERIFGPEKDWECACGKYRGMKYKGMICDRCGVKVTHSRVRRKRMGHIELAAPVVHIWFFKAMPSRLGTLLDMKTTSLEKIIYFQDYVVTDAGRARRSRSTSSSPKTNTARPARTTATRSRPTWAPRPSRSCSKASTSSTCRWNCATSSKRRARRTSRPSRSCATWSSGSRSSNRCAIRGLGGPQNKAEWMVLECIPVIPPDLRPLVLLDSGNFATSDLNDLYRRIINRNNRLKKLVDLNAPEVIIRNEKRMLQQSVDALFDNNRCKRPVLGSSNRPLKSLTDMIKGKQGRFRENLLGKRVDYSARSVIVVGPELRLHQCGLPKKIALELFQPFIIRRLKELGHADTIKSAKKMLERKDDQVWDILEEVIKNHPVLLNRAPTLHRMGIQAFEPVLIEGNAIRIHPLVCKGFNADFDGDQMAVHLPLSIEAQVEATVLMMSTNNIFSPANGQPIISPSQDIVMGCYYLTADRAASWAKAREAGRGHEVRQPGRGAYGLRPEEARRPRPHLGAAADREEGHQRGPRRQGQDARSRRCRASPTAWCSTTVGRVIFNDILHAENGVLRPGPGQQDAGAHHRRLLPAARPARDDRAARPHEGDSASANRRARACQLRDRRPADAGEQGRRAQRRRRRKSSSSRSSTTRGNITEVERYNTVIDLWTHARDEITKQMMEDLKNDRRDGAPYLNPIFLMAHSGARGGIEQIRQLAGMRGLMAKPNGTDHRDADQGQFPRRAVACWSISARRTAPARAWPTPPSRRPTPAT